MMEKMTQGNSVFTEQDERERQELMARKTEILRMEKVEKFINFFFPKAALIFTKEEEQKFAEIKAKKRVKSSLTGEEKKLYAELKVKKFETQWSEIGNKIKNFFFSKETHPLTENEESRLQWLDAAYEATRQGEKSTARLFSDIILLTLYSFVLTWVIQQSEDVVTWKCMLLIIGAVIVLYNFLRVAIRHELLYTIRCAIDIMFKVVIVMAIITWLMPHSEVAMAMRYVANPTRIADFYKSVILPWLK